MVSDVLIELWKRTNNTKKLEQHGILKQESTQEPKPKKPNKKERKILRLKNRKGKPISFRPTKENSDFISLQKDKTKTINEALDKLRETRKEW